MRPSNRMTARQTLNALACAMAIISAGVAAEAQSAWQVQSDPQQYQIAAALPGQDGNALSFNCTRPGAPSAYPDGRPIRPHAPGNLLFLLNPNTFGGGYGAGVQALFSLSVDGRPVGEAPMILAMPEAQLATNVTYDHALLGILRAGNLLEITETARGQKLQVSLAGISAALDQAIALCQSPVGQAPAAVAAAPGQAVSPSFDCRRASAPAELSICANPGLAAKDNRLDQAYKAAMAATTGQQSTQIRLTQREWLRARDNCRADVACIDQQMNTRLAFLQSIAPPAAAAPVGASQGAAPQQAAAGATAIPVPQAMWYGSLSCRRIKDVEAEFTITGRNPQGQYQAVLKTGTPASLSQGTSEINYLGEDSGPNAIRFVVERQVRGGMGMARAAGFVFDTAAGTGRFDGGDCQSLALERVTAASPRMRSIVPRPASGGSFYAATTDRAKCEALIAWAGRLEAEFPDIDFYRTPNGPEFSRTKIKIFGDEDFVPVFGAPFDVLDYDTRVAVRTFADRTCAQDPFVRDRMETYRAAAQRPIAGGGRSNELTSDGYTSTVFAVRKLREIRQAAQELAQTGARPGESFSGTVARLEQTRASINDRSGLLWPSERKALADRIDAAIAGLAAAEAGKQVAEVLSIREAGSAVQRSDAALRQIRNQFGKYLPAAERAAFEKQVTEFRNLAAEAILAPLIQAAETAPKDLAATRDLAQQAKTPPNRLSVLSTTEKDRFAKAYDAAVASRLSALVEDRIAKLAALPASKDGLFASSEWARAFEADFTPFEARAAVREAWSSFVEKRALFLEAALPTFEEELATAATAQEVEEVFATYLDWPGDESLPVYLEYELLKALAE